MLNVTSIRLKRLNSKKDSKVLGIASIELDNCLVIHGIKLIQLEDKRILSFPSKKVPKYEYDTEGAYTVNYEFSDIVHPSNADTRKYLEDKIFSIYDSEKEENN